MYLPKKRGKMKLGFGPVMDNQDMKYLRKYGKNLAQALPFT